MTEQKDPKKKLPRKKENLHAGHRSRKRKKFLEYGLDPVSPHEGIEYLLYYANARSDTNEIAHRLLNRFGSVEHLLNADTDDIVAVQGVGLVAATLIRLIPQIFERCMENQAASPDEDRLIADFKSAGKFFVSYFQDKEPVRSAILFLDEKMCKLDCKNLPDDPVCILTLNVVEEFRDIYTRDPAYAYLATYYEEDHRCGFGIEHLISSRLASMLKLLDIHLLDYLMITKNTYCSYKQPYAQFFHHKADS